MIDQHKLIKYIFLFAVMAIIVLSFLSYKRISNLIHVADLVNHTQKVKLELAKTYSLLNSIESSQRGFLITKDSVFLLNLSETERELTLHINTIDSLTQDNTSQQKSIGLLRITTYKRLDYLKEVLYDSQTSTNVPQRLLIGKTLMTGLSNQISKMENEEDKLMNSRLKALNKSTFFTPLYNIILILSSLIIILAAGDRILHDLKITDTLKNEIEKTEERYQRMIKEVKDYAIIFLSKDGIIENWNEGAEKIKGYNSDEIIGKNFSIFYTEQDRETNLPEKLLAEAKQKGTALHEGWRVRKNGSLFWGSIVITALHDKQNNLIGFSKVTRDLTNRKIAEDKIKKANEELEKKNEELIKIGERFLQMFDNNPVAMTFAEIGTNKIIYANNLFYTSFGYTKEEVIEHTNEELNLVSVEENQRLLPIIMSHLEEERSIEELKALPIEETAKLLYKLKEKMFENGFEVLYTRKNGETFFAIVFYELIDVGNKKYTLTSYLDITDRKKMEQQLVEQKNFAESILNTSTDLISAYNTELQIISFNKACENLFQMPKEQVIGKKYLDVFPMGENSQGHHDLVRALNGEIIHNTLYKSAVTQKFYENFITPLFDKSNKVYAAIAIAHDITDNILSSEKIKSANEELIKVNKELESFTYISSHDLQEPLRQIQNFTSRISDMEQNNLSDKGKEYFVKINKAAKRMQILITDLLAYSRTKTGDKKFRLINLKDIVNELLEDFTETIEQKDAIIEVEDLVDVNVIHIQFRQLMHNLIGNALKFSRSDKQPHIVIKNKIIKSSEVPNIDLSEETEYYHINVSDNGIGFESKYKDQIFEVFQCLNDKQKFEGTGMGLAIVKKIVENHNGIITASGELNKGATFDIYIPTNQKNIS